jgi:hypothetical protein
MFLIGLEGKRALFGVKQNSVEQKEKVINIINSVYVQEEENKDQIAEEKRITEEYRIAEGNTKSETGRANKSETGGVHKPQTGGASIPNFVFEVRVILQS